MRDTEKRMASGYEITQAIHIGDKEVVFGVDDKNKFDLKYICAYYKSNELLGEYSDCMASADYVEIMQLFANRLSEQCDMVRTEQERVTVPMEMITAEQCVPDDYKKNIEGKETRWERRDVMGEMKELPDWAKERLAAIQSQRQKAAKEREDR